MAKLIYSFLASLDGYIADDAGGFEWAVPDEEVLDFSTPPSATWGPISTGAPCTR